MNLTGSQIPYSNAEAAKILDEHGHKDAAQFMRDSAPVNVPGSGVQPWSAGALFPGVIIRVDHHDEVTGEFQKTTFSAQWKNHAQQGFTEREAAEAWIIGHKERESSGKENLGRHVLQAAA